MRCTVSDASTHVFMALEKPSVPSTSLKNAFHWRSLSVMNWRHMSRGFCCSVCAAIIALSLLRPGIPPPPPICPAECSVSLRTLRTLLRTVACRPRRVFLVFVVQVVLAADVLDRLLQDRLVLAQHVDPPRKEEIARLGQRVHPPRRAGLRGVPERGHHPRPLELAQCPVHRAGVERREASLGQPLGELVAVRVPVLQERQQRRRKEVAVQPERLILRLCLLVLRHRITSPWACVRILCERTENTCNRA